ncbi:M23 family metallopeptidase [Hymenobacter defluvii]|nr:M23 family metallopeptidase [Hymenobacter defluvii]
MLHLIKTWLWPVLAVFLLALPEQGLAQRRRTTKPKTSTTRRRDFFQIKSPTIKKVTPKTKVTVETEDLPDENSEAAKSILFNPAKKLSIVNEDTTSLNEGEQQIVETSEEVLIDSTWIKVAGYYAIWDTRNINPYRVDGRRIKDTLNLQLTDVPRQRFARMPLETTPITSAFKFRNGRWHYGVDLDLETGDSVRAAFDGVIRISKWDGSGYGNYLLVRHYNGVETLYGHLSKSLLPVGTFVKAGEVIGLGGSTGRSTGSHLHFEVRYEGNPIDPSRMYDFPDYKLWSDNFQITSALFNYYSRALSSRSSSSRSGSRGASSARRTVTHRIRSGDTVSGIAQKYGVSQAQIRRLNGNIGILRPGRTLRIK